MSILADKNSKVIVQGITGREGRFHTEQMIAYGTSIVGGVTPGKGGQEVFNLPIFNKMNEAVYATGADTTVIFVPAAFCKDAIIEAAKAGIKLIIVITEGIPVQDMVISMKAVKTAGATLIGPNCPGLTSVGAAKLGIMPGQIFKKGPVGVMSRSGTLTYEVVGGLTEAGIGQSSVIGIGGDAAIGSRFVDLLKLFKEDSETELVILIGEIGGSDEEDAALYVFNEFSKPVISFISGKSAPEGKRMGHAGAIVSGSTGTAESKVRTLRSANIPVVDSISEIPVLIRDLIKRI